MAAPWRWYPSANTCSSLCTCYVYCVGGAFVGKYIDCGNTHGEEHKKQLETRTKMGRLLADSACGQSRTRRCSSAPSALFDKLLRSDCDCNLPSDRNWLQATVSAHGARNWLKLKTQAVCDATLCRCVCASRGSEGSQCLHLQQQAVQGDEEGINTFRNVANHSSIDTASHHRRPESSVAPLWALQTSSDLRLSQRWLGT